MTEITNPALRVRSRSISLRKVLGYLHLWIGVIFSIPFAAIGLSGSLWMLVRDMPAPIEASAPLAHSIADIVAAASALAPPGTRPIAFEAPAQDKPAGVRFAEVRNRSEGGRREEGGRGEQNREERARNGATSEARPTSADQPAARPAGPPGFGVRITVDPVSLTPTLVPPITNGFARLMHDIHGSLMIRVQGRQFVGWLGVFMTGLGLTGIVLWWPRRGQWKRAFKVKLNGGVLRAVYDLHRVFGICTLVVFVIVCFSGVYIVFPQAVNQIAGVTTPVPDRPGNQASNGVVPVDGEEALTADAVVTLVQTQLQNVVLRTVSMPANPRQPYRVSFAHVGDFTSTPQITVTVDPWAKRIIETRDPANYPANDKFIAWQRALHSGAGLGKVWWVLVFMSGLLPPLFATTGVMMWWLRRKAR